MFSKDKCKHRCVGGGNEGVDTATYQIFLIYKKNTEFSKNCLKAKKTVRRVRLK